MADQLVQAGGSLVKLNALELMFKETLASGGPLFNVPTTVRDPDVKLEDAPEQPVGPSLGLRLAMRRLTKLMAFNPAVDYYYAVESFIGCSDVDESNKLQQAELLYLYEEAYSRPGAGLWQAWAKKYQWYDHAIILLADRHGNLASTQSAGCPFPTDAVLQAHREGMMDTTVGSVLGRERGFDPKDPHNSLPCGFDECPDARFPRERYITEGIKKIFQNNSWVFA
jgi:non-canonical (house-cleaning) NTP pyrophosphatase